MGRTVPAITLEFMRQQKAFDGFRRALKRSDQLSLDELFVSAKKHTAEAAYWVILCVLQQCSNSKYRSF